MTIDVSPAPAPAAPRRSWLRRIVGGPAALIRFLIRRFIWVIIRFVRAMWRYPIVALLAVLLIYLGNRGYDTYIADPPPPPAAPQFDVAPSIPPADSVVRYLDGQRRFDAQAMWDSYSPEWQANSLSQGLTLDTLRLAEDQQRRQGLQFGDSAYIGGYQTENVTYYFYMTPIRSPGGSGEIYQIFVVDADGKVLQIDTPQS